MNPKDVNRAWKETFHPEFAETEDRRVLTSHFGRHWFSSYWRLEVELERELFQYVRGDQIQSAEGGPQSIDAYLHPTFDHVEQISRTKVFKLDVPMQYVVMD
jgi:hypothetical protein